MLPNDVFFLLTTPEGCVQTFRYRSRQSEVKKSIKLQSPYKKKPHKEFSYWKKKHPLVGAGHQPKAGKKKNNNTIIRQRGRHADSPVTRGGGWAGGRGRGGRGSWQWSGRASSGRRYYF